MTPETKSESADTSVVSRQGSWEIIGAVLGRGTLAVSRSPRNPHGEALVLAPPCVRIPAAASSEDQISTQGWRVALWPSDEEGSLDVDVGRPTWVTAVSLGYVIGLIELKCPAHLSWVADRIERQLLNAVIAQAPDEEGVFFSFARDWQRSAEILLEELDAALSPTADAGDEHRGDDLERVLPDLEIAVPRNPGKHEPRLAQGWMRRFHSDLAANSPSRSPDSRPS